ncbi:MAG: hypothetical protein DRO11_06645, partial [Methanobacteriota archaeon]
AAGTSTHFDGESGSFSVSASNKFGDDFRGKGLLKLAPGKHYLQFSGSGQYWIKGGADSPEDFLGYSDFDNTVTGNATFPVTNYPAHLGDWNAGDPTWQSGKGKGIIGVINYLGLQRVNSLYFLTMNLGGDGQNTHPFASTSSDVIYDCSKLDQWGIVFDHAQMKGILLQIVLNEAEAANRTRLDGGALGTERKLFYREMTARFAHVNGLMWNICEEGIETFYPASLLMSFADYIKSVDPYDHPIGIHNWIKANDIDVVFADFYGHPSFDYLSMQHRGSYIRAGYPDPRYPTALGDIRAGTAAAGKPLALMGDELEWVLPSDDEAYTLGIYAKCGMKWQRKSVLWQFYLSGGAGVKYIVESLLNTHDFRVYEPMWRYTRYARNFMDQIPFADMVPSHNLLTGESTYAKSDPLISGVVLAKPGEIYAIQLPNASSTGTLNLSGASGDFTKRWYNPRTGVFEGATTTITGGGNVSLGPPPSSSSEDWVVLIEKIGVSPGMFQFSASYYSITEGDSGTKTLTVNVTRTGGTVGAVSVDYNTSDGSATLGDNDYENTSSTLNWANGDSSNKTFTVTVNGDTDVENSEYFNLILSNPTGGATLGPQNTAIAMINDDDGTTSMGVFQEVGGLVVMEVESTSVVWPWVEETAIAGYTGSSYYRMTINDFDPSTPSGELSYRFLISNPGTYRLRIRGWKPDVGDIGAHNDSWVKLVGHPGDEGVYNKVFMGGAAGVWNWDTTYDLEPMRKPRFNLSAGEHELRIAGRSDEYVIDRIVLYREDLVTTSQASNINNPQSPIASEQGMLQFSASNYSVLEGNGGTKNVTLAVTRTGGTTGTVSVDYATSDGTATLADNDYETASGTLIWTDGDSGNKTFTVTLNGDTNEENTEYFNLTLSNATGGAALGLQVTATVAITNDDGAPLGWSYQGWTNDATTGLDGSFPYTAAHHFCNAHPGSVTVNGVDFTTGRVTSGSGWNVGGAIHWTGDTSVNITGDSANIADQFLYGGEPRTVQFTGLTIGKTYKASFFSVGWDASGRIQLFSSGGNDLVLDQDYYGNNNGIVISYMYLASAASQDFTITKTTEVGTFHLYALANQEVPLVVDPTLPSVDAGPDMISFSGAVVELDPNVVNNDNEPKGTLTYLWTVEPDGIGDPDLDVVITDADKEDASVTITKTATGTATVVTMKLDVTLEGKNPVADSMKIDVYDDACAAVRIGLDLADITDFDENCITDLKDLAVMLAVWLVDNSLTAPVP